jgi:hypothetical protein
VLMQCEIENLLRKEKVQAKQDVAVIGQAI